MQTIKPLQKAASKTVEAMGGKAPSNPLQRKPIDEEGDLLRMNPLQLKQPANNPLQLQAAPIQFVRTSYGTKGGHMVLNQQGQAISVFLNHHLSRPEPAKGENFNPHVTTEVWYDKNGPNIGYVRTYENPGPAYHTVPTAFTWKPEHVNHSKLPDLIGHIMSDHQQFKDDVLAQNNNTFH